MYRFLKLILDSGRGSIKYVNNKAERRGVQTTNRPSFFHLRLRTDV